MGFVIAAVLLILALDLVALRRVWAEPYATRQQKHLQTVLVLLVPIFGAYGMLIFLKHGKDFDRGDFPKDPGINRNITGTRID